MTEKRVNQLGDIEVYKREHPNHRPEKDSIDHIGRWQYLYRKGDVEISLIELGPVYRAADWEIYQTKGEQIFEDVMRFGSKEEAEEKIQELL